MQRKAKILLILKIGAISFLSGSLLYLFFFSPYFRISSLKVKGINTIQRRDIETVMKAQLAKKWTLLPQDNFFIFFLRSKHFTKLLKVHFPPIDLVAFQPYAGKNFFNTLNIIIQERKPQGVWCSGPEENKLCFFFDKNGYLFRTSPAGKGPFWILTQDKTEMHFGLGDAIQDQNLVRSLVFLQKVFQEIPFLTPEKMEIINANHDILLKTTNGWKIYFDPQQDIVREFNVLNTLFERDKISPTEHLEYIDLRIQDKAYIKR